ncbi:DUF934 domain-containing protein [Marinomonas mediterranea]|jgi:Uncharacterized protein conserved in bacteria|uniref:Uncharacterized conserved protein UCP030820 n=1 Tax=Marinomonas mediterranea (strain ATCC 700492 / JCM 21426 / NBRC 103028 / MMB-1) TaxID=717774 RepID=F2JU45_MARM1|nr:DUF934 domain-containing protein [Marinomonas mediterranea]ADZ91557.1 Uncharacterized conserved protein UCP030820 [Marinomonas mediterranea MMB-1]WCN09520.1 DUF934 domain-containing protein [Marinomonas mediterranea]WCN13595.1 DUF934 domain-containing protein [Marinomonas mediterranea]WCN17661.1 DUF934 domain-containing protein [Marinomonas mediterranea MMB-1]
MQKLIKDGAIVDNTYSLVNDAEQVISENSIVPMQQWIENADTLGKVAGIWIDAGEGVEALENQDLSQLDVVAVNFPAFADGRGFSYGRLVRERLGFKGEVRAIGNFIPDQLGYLLRCGFSAFDFEQDVNLEKALELHKPFSVAYQGDVADPRPVFLRRG